MGEQINEERSYMELKWDTPVGDGFEAEMKSALSLAGFEVDVEVAEGRKEVKIYTGGGSLRLLKLAELFMSGGSRSCS